MRLVVVLLAIGCSSKHPADEAPGQPAPAAKPIDAAAVADAAVDAPQVTAATAPFAVELAIKPTDITRANRDTFTIEIAVKNLTAQVIDPQLNQSQLSIDGAPAKPWNMALSNSGHASTWRALPPGKTVTHAVAGLHEVFSPGEHTVVLIVSGVASAPVTVHVK